MNPLNGLKGNEEYLAQYQKYSLSYTEMTTDKSGNREIIKLAVEYSRLQEDTVELSDEGREMAAVRESLQVIYSKTSINLSDVFGSSETAETDIAAGLNDYFSPENTAQRIVDFASSFFPAFTENHADETDAGKVQNDFTKLMRDAIQKGFEEAQDLLGDFYANDTPDFITDTIGQTYDLVQQKLDALFGAGETEGKTTEPAQ